MRKSLFIALVAILGLIGCSRNQEIDVPDANLSLFARTESPAESRTVVESGVHVYWEPGDEIMVFNGDKSAKFTTDITAASGTATFKGTFGDQGWPEDLDLWAVYPFSENAVFDGETISTTLPSTQVAREGSFGKDMNLAIAHSNTSTLQFYNVGGGLRFSVLEEGIKKVMFEGLSGEIISGKVKIGLDENGKPEVKEVTAGSQFITLLPPSGQETFEPGVWYYIVAIPGSLEGGYKLRFYKDSDYARRVSEKAVQIKRSIFGNIEKADERIEYEATTTHFPQTEKEWGQSSELSKSIASSFYSTISKCDGFLDRTLQAKELIPLVLQIDGIIDAYPLDSGEGIILIQKDGVHINAILNEENQDIDVESKSSILYSSNTRKKDSAIIVPGNEEKKALLITPYQNSGFIKTGLSRISISTGVVYNNLNAIGYGLDWCNDDDGTATLPFFSPAHLADNYDLIIIATHGGFDTSFTDLSGKSLNSTVIMTSSEIGSIDFESAPYKNLGAFLSKDKVRYGITKNWLEGVENATGLRADFNKTIVFIMACNSYNNDDLAEYFLQRHASAYCGNTKKVSVYSCMNPGVLSFVELLAMGASVQKAVDITKEEVYDDFGGIPIEPIPLLASEETGSVCLIDPTPTNLHNTAIIESRTTLVWEQPKNTGEYRFKVHLKRPNSNSYSTYDCTTSKEYNTDVLQPGEYSWYVEANLYYDGKMIETFISDTKSFTVTEEIHYETPEAIDLGLSVKWASFNLGAAKKEDYGYYYAWGETEPYYSSLDPLVWKEGKEAGYDWPSYKWCKGTEDTITKYCFESSYGYNGFTDGKTILDLEDDAAHVNLGGKWRMPTDAEMTELRESCTWKWTSRDGVNGVDITGPNGNYIFLPAAGCWNWTFLGYVPTYGFYWSSSIRTDSPNAWGVSFDSDHVGAKLTGSRQMGYSIRPVYGNPDQRPRISVSPTVVDYGDVMVGERLGNETGRVTFSNTGGSDLSISRIWCTEGFSHSPSLTFPIVLSPGDSKTITFAFKPTEVKRYNGYLIVYSNASNDDGRVYVIGNGVE